MVSSETAIPNTAVLQALDEVMTPEGRAKWLAEWNEPGWWTGGRGTDVDGLQQHHRERMEANILAAAYMRRIFEDRARPAPPRASR